jgi:hypothetical protein
VVQATLGKKQDPASRITKSKKRAGGVAHVVEHLPSKHKTLSSSPNTGKKIQNWNY